MKKEAARVGDARGEIENLLYRYAEHIDAGDFAAVADLFAHAEITVEGAPGATRGRREVLALYESTTRRYEPDGTPRTKHVITNPLVEVDEAAGTATCRSYFTVFQQTEKLALQPIISGRYRDRFERVGGGWRFSARHMVLEQFGDLSQHLLIDAEAMTRS
jgi:3-phenylpropionate/cinnamic acid dioxygenase small subunit